MFATNRLALVLLISGLALFSWSCSEIDDSDELSSSMSDEQALVELMREDSDLEEVDAWGTDEGGSTDDPIDPITWGRLGRRDQVSISVQFEGDTFATITRTRTFNGNFRIVTDTTGEDNTYIDKPMYNNLTRKAHAIRVARTRFPRLNWRITEVTPEMLESAVPNPHTVFPTRVEVYWNGDSGMELLADISDPLNSYLNRDDLIRVGAEEELVFYVTPSPADPVFGVLHPRVYRLGRGARLEMRDDGVYPDVTADDGVYSVSEFAPARLGLYHAGVDLLDYETLFDSEAPYDAGGWAIPYVVE